MEFRKQKPESFRKAVEYLRKFNSAAMLGNTAFTETDLTIEGTVLTYKAVNPFGRVITAFYMSSSHKLIINEGLIDLSDPDRMITLMTRKINELPCTTRPDKTKKMDEIVTYLTRLCCVWNNTPTPDNASDFISLYHECSDNGWGEWDMEWDFIVKEDLEKAIADGRTVEHVLDFLCTADTESVATFLNKHYAALDFGWSRIAISELTPDNCGSIVSEGIRLGFNVKVDIDNNYNKYIVGFFNYDKGTLTIIGLDDDLGAWQDFFRATADKIVGSDDLYDAFEVFEQTCPTRK